MKLLTTLSFFALIAANAAAEPAIRSGDRIAIVGNTFADQLRIHGYLETLLLQHSDVSVRNFGWAGDILTARDRPTGFPTEESTLTDHRTDVIIACFGMSESFSGAAGIDDFKADLKAFIEFHQGKKYNGKTAVRLVLVSPIAYENLGELTPALEKRNEELRTYTRAMAGVAETEGIPFVDLFEPSRYLMNESKGQSLTTNGITLNAFGYWALSETFFEQLTDQSNEVWRLEIDGTSLDESST